ncbi:ABC transporter substrate-binding protein [Rhodoferax sp.]|uniref:ABC transporter substrate-binding protein n=1 Tax=Rhodoferax sp. TaxID=50421 RepID=UPI0027159806|nr:ABC transporter substrate-binding protein [Rhodoferax sp.]MDO8317639.1 ABC transporter substrate-binding protein [Rhodoferax sp.]
MMNNATTKALNELAPTGHIRVAINYGNPVLAQKNPQTGEPEGVSVDLARELSCRLHVPVELVTFDAAGKVFEALKASAWDVAFLAIDPVRAAEISFTSPYVVIEGTYIVRTDSPMHCIEDFDRPGNRIAVGRGAAYDLFLTRALHHAELVRTDTSAGAVDYFVAQKLDAAAGVRQPLMAYAESNPGLRVIEGRFAAIEQAMGTPKRREFGLAYLVDFIEEMKSSGFITHALQRSGQGDAVVAPARPMPYLNWPE